MNSKLFILLRVGLPLVLGISAAANDLLPELIIYADDTFIAQGGLGPLIFPLFEKRERCRIRAIGVGDGGQLLNRLQLDGQRKKSSGHLVVGIDQNTWGRIKPWTEPWENWKPDGYSELPKDIQIEKGFLPYDFGTLALMLDTRFLKLTNIKPPLSLLDLMKPEWKRNIILEDPRTSTPGLSFLLYTRAVLGEGAWNFWKQFRKQWLTLTLGWGEAYSLFLRNEAPLVWSYVTSQAFHEENGDGIGSQRRYQALLFKEGQPLQIEGAALVKGAFKSETEKKLARKFLEFLISLEVQNLIPKTLWMMPVRKEVVLPPSFISLPQSKKVISVWVKASEIEDALSSWGRAIQE